MDLQQEIELRMESIKRAALDAMEFPEVKEYIEILKRFSSIHFIKDNLTVDEYNEKVDAILKETDKIKENPNVRLFIDLVEKYQSLEDTKMSLTSEGPSRN